MKNTSAVAAFAVAGLAAVSAQAQSAPGFYIDGYAQVSHINGDGVSQSMFVSDVNFGIEPGDFSGVFGIDAGYHGYHEEGGVTNAWFFAPTVKLGNTKIGIGRTRAAGSVISTLDDSENTAFGSELALFASGVSNYFNLIADEQYGVLVQHDIDDFRIAVSYNRFEGAADFYSIAAEKTFAGAFSGGDLRVFGSAERLSSSGGGSAVSTVMVGAEVTTGDHRFGLQLTKGENFVFADEILALAEYQYNFRPNLSVHANVFNVEDNGFVALGGEYRFMDHGFARLTLGASYGGSSNSSFQDLTVGVRF